MFDKLMLKVVINEDQVFVEGFFMEIYIDFVREVVVWCKFDIYVVFVLVIYFVMVILDCNNVSIY